MNNELMRENYELRQKIARLEMQRIGLIVDLVLAVCFILFLIFK